jgi:hypothetical protein
MDQDSMIRPTRAVVFGAALVLAAFGTQFFVAPHAYAQWLPDRAYTEGPGIRVGDLELHPGVAVRGGYDTNVFRTPGTRSNPELDSAILAVTPHLNLTTLGRQRLTEGENAAGAAAVAVPPPVAFNLGLAATYFHYFRDTAPKNLEVDFDSLLNVLPQRTFGFDVGASYARNTRPFTAQVPGINNQTYAFDRVRPTLLFRGQSRGGVLQGSIGFAPTLTIYESSVFDYLSLYQYDIPGRLAWKFLPNTALLFDGTMGINVYANDPIATSTHASVFLSNGKRFQSRVGLNGAITRRLALRALVGYAAVLLDRGELDDHEDGIGEAALTFAWTEKDRIELGYQRTVDISNFGGWTQVDRGYAKSGMLFGRVFALNLEAGVGHVNYGLLLAPDGTALGKNGTTHREDIRIDGGVHTEYRATNWFAIMADFSVLATLTDFEYARGTNVPVYPGQFKTFQVFGGVRAHY